MFILKNWNISHHSSFLNPSPFLEIWTQKNALSPSSISNSISIFGDENKNYYSLIIFKIILLFYMVILFL